MQIEIPEQHLEGRDNCPDDECAAGLCSPCLVLFLFILCPTRTGQTSWRGKYESVAKGKVSILGNLPSVQTMPNSAGCLPPPPAPSPLLIPVGQDYGYGHVVGDNGNG